MEDIRYDNNNTVRFVVTILAIASAIFLFFGLQEKETAVVADSEVSATPSPTATPTAMPTPTPTPDVLTPVKRYVRSYGGAYTNAHLEYALSACGSVEKVKWIVAISVAESQMGTNSKRGLNWWSWGSYKFGSTEEGIGVMCKAVNESYVRKLVVNGSVNREVAKCYVKGCDGDGYPETWIKNVQISLNKMR